MRRRILLLFLLTILGTGAPGSLFAWDGAFFDLFQVPFTAREAALGGDHAAQADDISTLVSNPAGFRSAGPELSIGSVNLSVYNGPLYAGEATHSTWDLFGPLSIAYVGNGLGFGLFSLSSLEGVTYATGPTPGASTLTENLVLVAGYAFRLPLPDNWRSTLDIGFSVPIFLAGRSNTGKVASGLFASPQSFIKDQPFTIASGISMEFGVLYAWNDTFSVGVAGRNLAITSQDSFAQYSDYLAGAAGTQTTTPLPMDFSVGIRWRPPVKMLLEYVDGFSLMADYNDIFDFAIYPSGATNPLLHIGLGMEITLLRVVSLRAGFYQLLPSGGLSLDLSFFTLDMAVFGRELSREPWTLPVYGFMAGIRFHT